MYVIFKFTNFYRPGCKYISLTTFITINEGAVLYSVFSKKKKKKRVSKFIDVAPKLNSFGRRKKFEIDIFDICN